VAKQLNSEQLHELLVNLEGYDPSEAKTEDLIDTKEKSTRIEPERKKKKIKTKKDKSD
jgi:hypothetical protein